MMPKPHTTCLIMLPVGPGTRKEYLIDSIESINYYMGETECRVAILDDTRTGGLKEIKETFTNVDIFEAYTFAEGKKYQIFGYLFAKQAIMLKEVLDTYTFDMLLRIDTDSLIIGPNVQQDVLAFFQSHPSIGLVGAFQRRGDGSFKAEAMRKKGDEILSEMTWYRKGYKHPRLMKVLKQFMQKAKANGYKPGDMCTGGGFFISYAALQAIFSHDMQDLLAFVDSNITEDTWFSFLCFASGYRISDMPDDNNVLAINYRGLPMPLKELAKSNKKIVHPIKADDPAFEANVRSFFKKLRVAR